MTGGGGSTGPAQTLSITASGGEASMSFDGAAGQRACIQVTATTLPNSCGVAELVASHSATNFLRLRHSGDKGFLLPTGNYQVLVRPNGRATSTTTMRVILSTNS